MESIADLIQIKKSELKNEKVPKSKRAEIIKEIYSFYTTEQERKLRKIKNWKTFCEDCRKGGSPFKDPIVQEAFKSNKLFIKEYDIKTFCVRIAHIPSDDLYYVLSIVKDKFNRKESIHAWLFSVIK